MKESTARTGFDNSLFLILPSADGSTILAPVSWLLSPPQSLVAAKGCRMSILNSDIIP